MLDRRTHFLAEKLDEHIKDLTRQRDTALARCRELEKEKDEARELASYLTVNSVDCFAYRAELLESYPWMRDVTKSQTWLARHKAEALEAE